MNHNMQAENPAPLEADAPSVSNQWTGIDERDLARIVSNVRQGMEPTSVLDVFAAVASSVITEPGDSTWGAVTSLVGVSSAVEALVTSADARSFAFKIGWQDGQESLSAGWLRWAPRLNQRATIAALEHAAHVRATVVVPADSAWPAGLHDLGTHAPLVLYGRGNVNQDWQHSVAIVGARAATGYGEHVASEIAAELSLSGCTIVSGAAYGIDGVAHRAALAESRPTVAWLAGGIDRFYPSGHSELITRISEQGGAVFAETPCGTTPSKWRFLQRNRLIAAASQATIVIEAGARSGSLNTAGHAATLGRPLGAVPGPITSPNSAGCHRLLREYDAMCVTTASEVRELAFGDIAPSESDQYASPELVRLRDALSRRPKSVEEIASAAGFSVIEASGLLAEAAVAGWARFETGAWIRATVNT